MLSGRLKYGLLFVAGIALSVHMKADSPLADYEKAKEYYQKQEYDNAIRLYESLIKGGHAAVEVFYNLGNCHYKTGNIAQALINYERAKKLSPDDEDIDFNIKVASLKVVDKMDPVPEIFYKRWIKSISLLFTTDTWAKLLVANTWLLFIFLGIYIVAQSSLVKKTGLVFTAFFIMTAACTFLFSQQSHTITFVDQQGIVTSPSVYVKSSPDEKGTDQFIIHEGTKVNVMDELGDWKKIRIANGSVGWLKLSEIEII